MRMPFFDSDNNSFEDSFNFSSNSSFSSFRNFSSNKPSRSNPFGGRNITQLTEQVLNNDSDIGFVTSEGLVLPRNTAFELGFKNGIQPIKGRVWGGEAAPNEAEACEAETQVEVVYSQEALALIANEAVKSGGVETGGALIGSWERSKDGRISIHVERATGPGANAVHKPAMFSPSIDYYRYRIGYYRQAGTWDYLGEWHKHPGSFDSLSMTDIDTARGLIRDEGWPLLLLPIVNAVGGCMTMETNLILSKQLGSKKSDVEFLPHVSAMTLEPVSEPEPLPVYIDSREIEAFRSGSDTVRTVGGIYNPDESFIFLALPEESNAVLKLVRASDNAAVSGVEGAVTAIVSQSDVSCYFAYEGEIRPLKVVLIDPANSIYERNAGLTETSVLKNKAVTIVGCGSLGSTLAMSLARAGVGTFYLFDCDKLSPVNIARHQAGLRDLGREKTAVLRDLIHGTNPYIDVDTCTLDIVKTEAGYEAFCEAAARSDLLICTTDTDDSRLLVNEFAVEHGVKAIQAGLSERASNGLIHLYDPASGEACWQCHRDRVLVESDKRNEGVAYSEARDIRDLTVQPGLAAQINVTAEIAALRCIEALMGRTALPALTVVYIDTPESADGQRQLCLRLRHLGLERVASCPVCGETRFNEPDLSDYDDDADGDDTTEEELDIADGTVFSAEAGGTL